MIPTPFRPAKEPFPLPANAKQNQKGNFLWRSPQGEPFWVKPECIDEFGNVFCEPLVCSECQLKAAAVESNNNDVTGLVVVGALIGVGLLAWYAGNSLPQQTPLPSQPPQQVTPKWIP